MEASFGMFVTMRPAKHFARMLYGVTCEAVNLSHLAHVLTQEVCWRYVTEWWALKVSHAGFNCEDLRSGVPSDVGQMA